MTESGPPEWGGPPRGAGRGRSVALQSSLDERRGEARWIRFPGVGDHALAAGPPLMKPPEADLDRIDLEVVLLQVNVLPSGHAGAISILADPGHGFGRAAVACAKRMIFSAARDRHGKYIQADAPPTSIRFTR